MVGTAVADLQRKADAYIRNLRVEDMEPDDLIRFELTYDLEP